MDREVQRNYIVYPDYGNLENIEGYRASYFYMDGKMEDLVGYDCCNFNVKLLRECLCQGIKLAECTIKEITYPCLVICNWNGIDRMEGYICLIDDFKAIERALLKYKIYIKGDWHWRNICTLYLETAEFIRNTIKRYEY